MFWIFKTLMLNLADPPLGEVCRYLDLIFYLHFVLSKPIVTGSPSTTSPSLPVSLNTSSVPMSAPSQTAGPNTSMKAGTAVNIGRGVGAAVRFLAALLALFLRRRRRRQAGHTMLGSSGVVKNAMWQSTC